MLKIWFSWFETSGWKEQLEATFNAWREDLKGIANLKISNYLWPIYKQYSHLKTKIYPLTIVVKENILSFFQILKARQKNILSIFLPSFALLFFSFLYLFPNKNNFIQDINASCLVPYNESIALEIKTPRLLEIDKDTSIVKNKYKENETKFYPVHNETKTNNVKSDTSQEKLSEDVIFVTFSDEKGKKLTKKISFPKEKNKTFNLNTRQSKNEKIIQTIPSKKKLKIKQKLLSKKKNTENTFLETNKIQYCKQGLSFFNKKDISRAKNLLDKCIQGPSKNYQVYYALGKIAYSSNFYYNAITYFKLSLHYNKKFLQAELDLAKSYIHLKKYSRASYYLYNLLKLKNKNWEVIYYTATLYKFSNEPKKALALIQKYITKKPYSTKNKLHHLKGELLYSLKRYKLAIRSLRKATQNNSYRSYPAYYTLALAYKNLKLYKKARRALKIAIKISPIHYKSYLEIAKLYLKIKKFKLALEHLETALAIHPSNKNICTNILLISKNIQKPYKKLSVLGKCVHNMEENQKNYDFFLKAGDHYLAHKIYKDSIFAYKKAIKSNSYKLPAYYKIASLFKKIKRYRNAELSYLELIRHQPKNPVVYKSLGLLYEKNMNLPEKAKASYKKYLSLRPIAKDALKIRNTIKSL